MSATKAVVQCLPSSSLTSSEDEIDEEASEEELLSKISELLLAKKKREQDLLDYELSDVQTNPPRSLTECFLTLSNEAKEFYLSSSVPERFQIPKPLDFYRNWVSYNRPVIFRKAAKSWPALKRWTNDYLSATLGTKEVSVTITPDGYADSIKGDRFVMPYEETMTMADFISILENPAPDSVHYIQKQNSNLTDEFSEIIEDVQEIAWASEAFGKEPDAINFWMGDQRAVTSTHKDPYENIYCVVRGRKDIILYPPTDLPWLPYRDYQRAIYKKNKENNEFTVEDLEEEDSVSWIDLDPLKPDLDKYPEAANASPIKCHLEAGDVLYLPSLWFHHLRQSQGCIAVNFWYDMEYDSKYNYFNFLSNLVNVNKEIS